MAFQVGDIKISGTIENLSFYNSEFGWLVRRKGGPSRKQYKTSKSFARARQNNNKLAACSRAASLLRKHIIKQTGVKDKTLYHRLFKLLYKLPQLPSLDLHELLLSLNRIKTKKLRRKKVIPSYRSANFISPRRQQDAENHIHNNFPTSERPHKIFVKTKRKLYYSIRNKTCTK